MSTTESKSKKTEYPETGMWECEFLGKKGTGRENYPPKGEKRIYHASTATTLAKKDVLKIVKEIKDYIPKTMKQ